MTRSESPIPDRVRRDDVWECHARLAERESAAVDMGNPWDKDVWQAGRLVLERAIEAETEEPETDGGRSPLPGGFEPEDYPASEREPERPSPIRRNPGHNTSYP